MKREITNKIRYILEEILPPLIRDSFIFEWLVFKFYRKDKIHKILKKNILNISNKEYNEYYQNMPRMHDDSDLSEKCIKSILENITGTSVLDVGCGSGYLLKRIREKFTNMNIFGSEIVLSENLDLSSKQINAKIILKDINDLSKISDKFDTVICTHVLEHVLEIEEAYKNLLNICKKKLIIVIPRERPYEHTFNGHLHFFPYEWSFINRIKPKNKYEIKEISRDFFYLEFFK